ncbi:ATP-binding protein [Actinomycetospora endophytica]|uniref:ATP-binding protein n=1 Tax=Actinomycetospora endophytica TaxID=2291215 RepID=A0ABS8P1M4_9PSEU|nr:ATP-binding protein [Actinomycetospora endophytica]MCD2192134.1 ATP-binding protein [Actinomycetospora endophytica]
MAAGDLQEPAAPPTVEVVGARVTRSDRRGRTSAVRLVAGFIAAGVLVTVGLALAVALIARERATAAATQQVTQIAFVTAKGAIEPQLTDGVLAGDPAALAALDTTVRRSVLAGSLVRVMIWDASGKVLYSDDPALVGRSFDLEDRERVALAGGGQGTEISDPSRPENATEAPFGQVLEVYTGIRSVSGTPLLYETDFRDDAVSDAGWDAWRTVAPLSVAALVVLELVQVPLVVMLVRRLRARERQRDRLLHHAVEASTAERRRIAEELRDGVVSELTRITYALDASRMKGPVDPDARGVVADAASRLRESAGALCSLLVDICPPDLTEEGLDPALRELAGGLQRRGIGVAVSLDGVGGAGPDEAALLYRAAQEALRNVVSHSGAEHVDLSLAAERGRWRLVVDDDGHGFDDHARAARSGDGHAGLHAIGDLIADMGGTLTVRAAPGQGTRVEVVLPRS